MKLVAILGLLVLLAGCSVEVNFSETENLNAYDTGEPELVTTTEQITEQDIKDVSDKLDGIADIDNIIVDSATLVITNLSLDFTGVESIKVYFYNDSKTNIYTVINPYGNSANIPLIGSELIYYYKNPPLKIHAVLIKDEPEDLIPEHYQINFSGRIIIKASLF